MNEADTLQSRLGYRFHNQALLKQALTHRSCGRNNNERLEYLGDSALGLVITNILFMRFPQASVGNLTKMRAHLVCNEMLAVQSRSLAIQKCLLFANSLAGSASNNRNSILANTFEAIIGALYLDSDLATVETVIVKLFALQLAEISPLDAKDNKTQLQEHLQKQGLPTPHYEIISRAGKSHVPTFTVACKVSGLAEPVLASGSSRRVAEQQSASKALTLLVAQT